VNRSLRRGHDHPLKHIWVVLSPKIDPLCGNNLGYLSDKTIYQKNDFILELRLRLFLLILLCAIDAFLFLVPVMYVHPQGVFHCPLGGCNFPRYGSVTYWAFRVGGVWMDKGYYAFYV